MEKKQAVESKEDMQSSDRSLADMQSDMLLEMFASLTMIEIIMSISAVCKCWKSLSSELTMWKTLDLTMFRDYFRSQHLERANERGLLFFKAALNLGGHKTEKLKFDISPDMKDELLVYAAERCPHLKHLFLPSLLLLTDQGLSTAFELWGSTLETLIISLYTRQPSASIFQIIGQNCKILTVLRLRVCDLDNQISSTITNCLPGLKVFVLRCDAIEKDALKNLLDGLANLDELYISISAIALATDPFGLSEILAPFQDESIVQKASMLRVFHFCLGTCAKVLG